jgi:hypothetical protein
MQKKIYLLAIAALMAFIPEGFAQRNKSEFTFGYGYYSSYQFFNYRPYNTSTGTYTLGYRYYVSSAVTLGLNVGMERIYNWAGFTTIAPEVTVKYLDTKNHNMTRIRMYGSVSYGISAVNDLFTGKGQADESGGKPWGAHVSPFGIRIGRQLAGFAEVGFGYKGLFNGGIALRVPRTFNRHQAEETAN